MQGQTLTALSIVSIASKAVKSMEEQALTKCKSFISCLKLVDLSHLSIATVIYVL